MIRGHCILGGTFTYVHAGHERLLSKCRGFSKITIGLTSDAYVKRHKIYPSFPYKKRLSNLKRALAKMGLRSRATIIEIDDEMGGADENTGADAIIVSTETAEAARRINYIRRKRRLQPLDVPSVPLSYGKDLKKISCHSIYAGKTDAQGRLLKPLRVQAGTDNPSKLCGASRALSRIFGKNFSLRGHPERTGVPDHPFNSETFEGAKNRARAAWTRSGGGCDYSLGMESGLFELKRGVFIDITVCAVFDGEEESYGTGMGFLVPTELANRIKREKSDLSRVLREMTGVKDIGKKHGAIGYFSAGVLHRSEQIEQSVLCAFVPRLARARVGSEY